jgi:hypothetical protein
MKIFAYIQLDLKNYTIKLLQIETFSICFFNNFFVLWLWDYTKTYEVQILPNILTFQAKLSLKIYKRLKHSPNTAMDYNLQPIFLDSL